MPDTDAVLVADDYWAYHCNSAHFWNIDRGDVDQIEHWEDLSPGGVAERVQRLEEFARRADSALAGVEDGDRPRTMMAAVSFSARATAALLPYTRDLSLVAGPMNLAAFMTVMVPGYVLTTRQHGEGYIAKLQSFPSFVDGWIAGFRDGAAVGRIATARGVAAAVAAFDAMLRSDPADDPLTSQAAPTEMTDREADEWRTAVVNAVRVSVRPAVARIRAALHDAVLPTARSDDEAGVCHLRGGVEDYHALLMAATSTDLTPERVHQIGWERLSLLDEEYRVLGATSLGMTEPSSVRGRLRDDPLLRYTTAGEIIADAMATLARAEAAVPRWFTRVPQTACAAVAVDAGPMAFYTGPSPDGARGGTFFYKTSDPTLWTRFNLEVTTFHESVPGHHLQLALSQELDLHPVLSELEVTSYGEGWGLYAERLADEMSLYSGPLQRLGMLTADSLRAARLVVDTGLHAKGWTRGQAVDFLMANTSLPHSNAESEVDRYIADPGQATSYMIGRLELDRLRDDARTSLGVQFSVRDFHDTVLGNGMTPLPELGRSVDAWVSRVLSGG